jgi:acyl-CoA reductase-like NAD-dependent aldehyde dehydrogenase
LRGLRRALQDIQKKGTPTIPGPVSTRPDGQVTVQVFPETGYDRLLYGGTTIEVWMEPGVTAETLAQTQALAYHQADLAGRVALVLGAGNFSALGICDALYKLFVENQVVALKMNPVNAYAGPFISEGFRALVSAGFLRVVYGGSAEGAFLCAHAGIDQIHITGSDKTFDAILFGTGSEGARRKVQREPILNKRLTGELGNIAPVIIVPGSWSASEIDYQAEKLVSWMVGGTGFVCHAPHVLFTHARWPQRKQFMDALRKILTAVPLHKAFYPGTRARQQAFITAHPEAELFGQISENKIPWTLIPAMEPENNSDICFTTEPFCGLLTEIPIRAADTPQFIQKAVDFANQVLWGTLDAAIVIQPASLRDAAIADAVDDGIARLRYGIICINAGAGVAWLLTSTPWGGFAGQEIFDVQSGIGFVHNTLMFSRPQKTVLRAPFVDTPKSPFLVSGGKVGRKVSMKLATFEADPSIWKIPGILSAAMGF